MTDAELRELDANIACHLFGWRWFRSKRDGLCTLQPPEGGDWTRSPWGPDIFDAIYVVPPDSERYRDWAQGGRLIGEHGRILRTGLPCYSTDIVAAWLVVAAFDSYTVAFEPDVKQHYAKLVRYKPEGFGYAREDTMPLAVCRAALCAVNR